MSLLSRIARLETKAAKRGGPSIKTLLEWITRGPRPRPVSKQLAERIQAALTEPDDPWETP